MFSARLNLIGLLFLMVLGSCQIDDVNSPSPGDTFIKYYGGDGSQLGRGMIYLENDANFIIYGAQNRAEDGSTANLYILRVDEQGNELDEVSIDFSSAIDSLNINAADDTPGSLIYDETLGFIYVGSSTRADAIDGGTYDVLIWAQINVELDSTPVASGEITQLDIEVNIDGDTTITALRDVSGLDVVVSGENQILVVGSTTKIQDGDLTVAADDDETQIYTALIDITDGTVIRERTNGFTGNDVGLYIDQFGEDDFVIVGTTENRVGTEGTNAYFLPINANGVPLEGSSIGFSTNGNVAAPDRSANETVQDVFKRPNGYVITGASVRGGETHPYFINVSYFGNGNFALDVADTISVVAEAPAGEDNLTLTSQNLNAAGTAITIADNGNYFVAGSILRYPTKNAEILIMQSDQGGDLISGSVRNFGLASGNDAANEIIALSDGSLLVLTTVDFGSGNFLMGLLKVNQNGDLMN